MIYLIDYENVREHGLKNIRYKKDDMIYLFYTANAAKIELDALSEIEAAMKFIKVAAGKQSLDMHLISYLGYLICEHEGRAEFVIVSNDAGYDGVLRFWQAKGYKCSRRLINTAQRSGASGSRTARTRTRTRSGARRLEADSIRDTEEKLIPEAADPAENAETAVTEEAAAAENVLTEAPVEALASEAEDAAQAVQAETEPAAEEILQETKTARRTRRGRRSSSRKKQETAEETVPETAQETEAAAEEKPKLPAPVAGRITMQIIPVKVVENAVPTMPKQEKAQAEEIAEEAAEPEMAEEGPDAEETVEAAETENTEVTVQAEEEASEENAEEATEEAPAEEMEAAAAEEAAVETPEEPKAEKPAKERRTRTRRSSRKSAKKTAEEQPEEEKTEAAPAAEDESTQLNNKVMGLYSKAGIDHKIAGQIASLVVKNMNENNRKAVIYRKIVKQFGQKQGLEYYNVIKKDI